jgi:hypothetical protein
MFRRIVLILLALLISGVALAEEEKRFSVPVGASPVYGNKDAPVTIIEFIDYQ